MGMVITFAELPLVSSCTAFNALNCMRAQWRWDLRMLSSLISMEQRVVIMAQSVTLREILVKFQFFLDKGFTTFIHLVH